jgi:putative tryptophan/tyrosine transport system substrate-binding protein
MRLNHFGRREFVTLLGGATVLPLAARAQQLAMPVVGFMHSQSPETVPVTWMGAFRQGLKETGFVEGQNVLVEYRWARGQYDRLPELAADLVRRQVAVIAATGGEPSPQIAMAATQTIPIVFTANGDPVRDGLVATLHQPGGNVTGITIFGAAAATKRLQLLHELVPQAATIAFLMNPNNPNADNEMRTAQAAAQSLGLQMPVLRASSERELDTAIAPMAPQRGSAVIVASDTFFFERRDQLVSQLARYQIPAIYHVRGFAQAGGLMTYGNDLVDAYRLVGVYVGRTLKGDKPADLPVQQSAKFELVINLKSAKALGLDIPLSLLVAVDEVIE